MQSVVFLAKCKKCDQVLQGKPVVLNCCRQTICAIHLEEINSNGKRKLANCPFCETSRETKIKKNAPIMTFSKKFEPAIVACRRLDTSLNEFRQLKKDPKCFIFEYVSKLKNQVDLRREEIKLEIEKLSDEMIKKLEDFERECYENVDRTRLMEQSDAFLEETQARLEEWSTGLDAAMFDEVSRAEINSQARNIDLKLNDLSAKLKECLLMNQEWIHNNYFSREFSKLFGNELIAFKGLSKNI